MHTYTYIHIHSLHFYSFKVWRVGVHSIYEAFSTQQLIKHKIKEGTQHKNEIPGDKLVSAVVPTHLQQKKQQP